jgi:hypothetical protein
VAILAGLTTAALIGIFKNKILLQARKLFHFAFDSTSQIELKRIEKYSRSAKTNISHALFQELKEDRPELSLKEIGENRIRIRDDHLSADIVVTMEPDIQASPSPLQSKSADEKVVGTTVEIKTAPAMSFGFRSYSYISDFERLSSDIADTVASHCFDEKRSDRSRITGEVDVRKIPHNGEIKDNELGLTGEFKGSKLRFTIDDPDSLTQGIKRQFKPF